MTKIVCKYCIMQVGLKGSDLANWPDKADPNAEEWLYNHIESEHHIPVRREDETIRETKIRFGRAFPEAGGVNCKCPSCVRQRRLTAYG